MMPTVDAVMRPAFGRPKIMEALELFGVRAAPRQGAKALKEQLLQLIQDQAPGRVVSEILGIFAPTLFSLLQY